MTLVGPDGRPLKTDLWLMVRMDPMDGLQGEFFVTHARNFQKFDKRKGFTVMAHSFDREALTLACRQATISSGEAYQPKHSAFRQQRPNLVGDNPNLQPAMPNSALNSGELLDPTEPENDITDSDFS